MNAVFRIARGAVWTATSTLFSLLLLKIFEMSVLAQKNEGDEIAEGDITAGLALPVALAGVFCGLLASIDSEGEPPPSKVIDWKAIAS